MSLLGRLHAANLSFGLVSMDLLSKYAAITVRLTILNGIGNGNGTGCRAVIMVSLLCMLSACQHIQLAGNPMPVSTSTSSVQSGSHQKHPTNTHIIKKSEKADDDSPFFILEDWF
ncbi:MAG: hypothetical protein Q4G13_04955 [Moraxella sp.]|nr:hypothetical protein [Moraxella sp.]